MINYPLKDIKTILEVQGYTNIYIDMRITAENNTAIGESILLCNEGGNNEAGELLEDVDFALYVRRQDPEQARIISRQIFNFLSGYSGGLNDSPDNVQIRRIVTRQAPIPFPTTGIPEWLATYTAQINNPDFAEFN